MVGHVDSEASVLVFLGLFLFFCFFPQQLELLTSGCCHTLAHKSVIHRDFFKASEVWEGEHYLHVFASSTSLTNGVETMCKHARSLF